MDCNKFCFILCVNNQRYLDEALFYINRLNIPDGYTIDCISITDAESMTSGYNEAMNASDAKYKIYMHQDVLIVDADFLFKLLNIFSNSEIGMTGIVGPTQMPPNGIMWEGMEIGGLYSSNIYFTVTNSPAPTELGYTYVDAVDGMLIATQYDIPWREDLFDGWDFYDASQSYEFRKMGYKIAVPMSESPLVIHNDGLLNLRNYYKYRKVFVKEYLN